MQNAKYVIEVVVATNDRVSIPFHEQPEKRVICTLLATGIFKSLRLIDVIRSECPFFIEGPTIAEYGKMWLEHNQA